MKVQSNITIGSQTFQKLFNRVNHNESWQSAHTCTTSQSMSDGKEGNRRYVYLLCSHAMTMVHVYAALVVSVGHCHTYQSGFTRPAVGWLRVGRPNRWKEWRIVVHGYRWEAGRGNVEAQSTAENPTFRGPSSVLVHLLLSLLLPVQSIQKWQTKENHDQYWRSCDGFPYFQMYMTFGLLLNSVAILKMK